jgi:hypothetical protein
MTFKEFMDMSYGIDLWQIYLNGKMIVDVLDIKYASMTITEFDFDADDYGRITCTVDLK